MLEARGVDYWCAQQTTFFNGANDSECMAYEYGVDAKLAFKVFNAQPEQAIAATLGPAIVRCRDCKHACEIAGGGLACTFRSQMMHETTADAFCSDGEREEG